jgi:acyl carrier protein
MSDLHTTELMKQAFAQAAPHTRGRLDALAHKDRIADLGLDSIATMEAVGYLEERIGRVFPDEALARLDTVGDLAALLEEHAAEAS